MQKKRLKKQKRRKVQLRQRQTKSWITHSRKVLSNLLNQSRIRKKKACSKLVLVRVKKERRLTPPKKTKLLTSSSSSNSTT